MLLRIPESKSDKSSRSIEVHICSWSILIRKSQKKLGISVFGRWRATCFLLPSLGPGRSGLAFLVRPGLAHELQICSFEVRGSIWIVRKNRGGAFVGAAEVLRRAFFFM